MTNVGSFRVVEFQIGVNIVGLPIFHKHVIDDTITNKSVIKTNKK